MPFIEQKDKRTFQENRQATTKRTTHRFSLKISENVFVCPKKITKKKWKKRPTKAVCGCPDVKKKTVFQKFFFFVFFQNIDKLSEY